MNATRNFSVQLLPPKFGHSSSNNTLKLRKSPDILPLYNSGKIDHIHSIVGKNNNLVLHSKTLVKRRSNTPSINKEYTIKNYSSSLLSTKEQNKIIQEKMREYDKINNKG